ncbi:MAG: DUF4034 domain-containing protein [Terracidiphilus sp.]
MHISKFAALFVLVPSFVLLSGPMKAQTAPASPGTVVSEEDENSLHETKLRHLVEADLVEEKFDDLDQMASQFRSDKSRFPGGSWKLTTFYEALDKPMLTDKDTLDHLAHLKRWVAQRPESITARVALAASLHRWAWVARGNGMANTVTSEGWRLFDERIQESLDVLNAAANLHERCPQWYSEMMIVGLAQSWDEARMRKVFEQGIQFEPEYFRLYKQMANYLLPKWDGKPGDAVAFATTAADRVGGDQGDEIYFHIAVEVIGKNGRNFGAKEMDWPRIQRGYQALTAQYGTTGWLENKMAYFAYEFRDATVARRQFERIGDHWNRGVWRDRERFDKARDWAQRRP